MADELRLDVGGQDHVLTDPGQARASARRWRRMAAELDTPDAPPEASIKMHELRARAKAAEDWARQREDRQLKSTSSSSGAPQPSTKAPPSPAPTPAGEPGHATEPPSRGARRQAATALAASGVRKGRRSASAARTRARTATRRYEAAGGAPVATGAGELALFFFGSIVLLVLFEDVLTKKGSAGFSTATKTVAELAHRLIAPVPIVTKA